MLKIAVVFALQNPVCPINVAAPVVEKVRGDKTVSTVLVPFAETL